MDEDFDKVMQGQFGVQEKMLGPEAYQANVNLMNLQAKHMVAITDRVVQGTVSRKNITSVIVLLSFPPYIMLMIFLFKLLVL